MYGGNFKTIMYYIFLNFSQIAKVHKLLSFIKCKSIICINYLLVIFSPQ